MIQVSEKLLTEHKAYIILEQAVNHCESKGTSEVRFSPLRKLCDSRIQSLGMGSVYGGNFATHLSNFDKPAGQGDSRTSSLFKIRRVNKPNSTKHSTLIKPDIPAIRTFFETEQLNLSSQDMQHSHLLDDSRYSDGRFQTIDPRKWEMTESLVIEEELKTALKTDRLHSIASKIRRSQGASLEAITRNAMIECGALARRTRWDVLVMHDNKEEFRTLFSEMRYLAILMNWLRKSNNYPFRLVIEYKGHIDAHEDPIARDNLVLHKMIVDKFEKWLRERDHLGLSSVDKELLLSSLTKTKRELESTGVGVKDNRVIRAWDLWLNKFMRPFLRQALDLNRLPPLFGTSWFRTNRWLH